MSISFDSDQLAMKAMALDPVQMARFAGIEPDEWQARFLRSQAQRVLLNCSRQVGKSSTTAILSLHTATYNPGSTTLLLSPSLRQSSLLFQKCLEVYRALGKPVEPETENKLSLELKNGSRIVSLPGKEGTIRGFSAVDLLVIDEASRVEESLYYAVKPMLAVSNGRLVLLSTPWGTRGFFWEAWKNKESWDHYRIDATQCPRISEAFLEEERESKGSWWFQQEYMCEFLDAQSSAFRSEDIDKIVDREIEIWAL